MNPLLIKQFEYERWANLRWLDFLLETETPELYAKIMGHVLGAQTVWVVRIEGDSLTAIPSPCIEVATIERLHERWVRVLATRSADEVIQYRRTTGEPMSSTLEEIALHVVSHGTYHRGELRGLCRTDGIDSFPETDRIRFTLEQE